MLTHWVRPQVWDSDDLPSVLCVTSGCLGEDGWVPDVGAGWSCNAEGGSHGPLLWKPRSPARASAAVPSAASCDTAAEALSPSWVPRAPRTSRAMCSRCPRLPLPEELHPSFPPAGHPGSFPEAFEGCSLNTSGLRGQDSPTTAAAIARLWLQPVMVHIFEQRIAVRAVPRGIQCSCQLWVVPAHLGCSRLLFTKSPTPPGVFTGGRNSRIHCCNMLF